MAKNPDAPGVLFYLGAQYEEYACYTVWSTTRKLSRREELFRKSKALDKALAYYTRAAVTCPELPVRNAKAMVFALKGRYLDGAKEYGDILRTLRKTPEHSKNALAEAYVRRGLCFFWGGESRKALRCLDIAEAICPCHAVYGNKALIYESTKDYEKAIREHEKCLLLQPGSEFHKKRTAYCRKRIAAQAG